MNISPDDFEKLGIDESNLDEKAEQTTYKIRYVARYVRQLSNFSGSLHKSIGGYFDAEYVRHCGNRKSACIGRKVAF